MTQSKQLLKKITKSVSSVCLVLLLVSTVLICPAAAANEIDEEVPLLPQVDGITHEYTISGTSTEDEQTITIEFRNGQDSESYVPGNEESIKYRIFEYCGMRYTDYEDFLYAWNGEELTTAIGSKIHDGTSITFSSKDSDRNEFAYGNSLTPLEFQDNYMLGSTSGAIFVIPEDPEDMDMVWECFPVVEKVRAYAGANGIDFQRTFGRPEAETGIHESLANKALTDGSVLATYYDGETQKALENGESTDKRLKFIYRVLKADLDLSQDATYASSVLSARDQDTSAMEQAEAGLIQELEI